MRLDHIVDMALRALAIALLIAIFFPAYRRVHWQILASFTLVMALQVFGN
ncbi:hypothetical protein ACLKMY_00600 [Paraburkholderia mimosarum]